MIHRMLQVGSRGGDSDMNFITGTGTTATSGLTHINFPSTLPSIPFVVAQSSLISTTPVVFKISNITTSGFDIVGIKANTATYIDAGFSYLAVYK